MIWCLDTVDDFDTISIDFDDGATAATYTPTAGLTSAIDVVADLVDWLNSNGYSVTGTAYTRSAFFPGAIQATITNAAPIDVAANATAESLLGARDQAGLAAATIQLSGLVGSYYALGTPTTPHLMVRRASVTGAASGSGAILPDIGATGLLRPSLEAPDVPTAAEWVRDAVARSASPRVGYLVEAASAGLTGGWHFGRIDVEQTGGLLSRIRAEAVR